MVFLLFVINLELIHDLVFIHFVNKVHEIKVNSG